MFFEPIVIPVYQILEMPISGQQPTMVCEIFRKMVGCEVPSRRAVGCKSAGEFHAEGGKFDTEILSYPELLPNGFAAASKMSGNIHSVSADILGLSGSVINAVFVNPPMQNHGLNGCFE